MQKDFVIKAKHAVKRVAAISAGATLMGATMMGAVAADLSDYPAPFVENGQLNGIVVVGVYHGDRLPSEGVDHLWQRLCRFFV